MGWKAPEKKERGYYLDEYLERDWVHFGISKINSSKTTTIALAADLLEPRLQQRKTALIMGINYTKTRYELHGCINDALNVRELVVSTGVNPGSILFTTDNTKQTLPTYDNLLSFFKQLVTQSESNDRLFCYYSGHGVAVRQSNKMISECICPLSNNKKSVSMMTDDVLFDAIEPSLAMKTDVNLLFIADSCFSEGLLNSTWVYIPDQDGTTIREMKNRFGRLTQARIQLLSGATSFQPTMDVGGQNVVPHGAFTNCFLKFMKSHQGETISYRQLILGVHQCVKSGKFKQIMCFGSSYQLNLDDPFVFP